MQKKLLLSICLIVALVLPIFTSCGMLGDESLAVEDILLEPLSDGSVRITFYYLDADPESFTIPTIAGEKGDKGDAGEKGETGVGIAGIRLTSDGKGTQTMTVTYTDESMEPVEVKVKDGIHIVSTTREDDEETGIPYMVVNFSDGTQQRIELPKGADGDVGMGIKDLTYSIDPDTNETVINFILENDEYMTPIMIRPGKAGEAGKSIDRVETAEWLNEDGERLGTTLNFYLADAEEPLASVNLSDGVGVSDVASEDLLNEEGKKIGTRFYFTKTDGETTEGIEILDGVGIEDVRANLLPNGKTKITVVMTTGEEHEFEIPAVVSIRDIDVENNDNGDVLLTIHMSDGSSPYTALIPKGVGISDMRIIENPENSTEFLMLVTYTDGSSDEVPFNKPTPWSNGNGVPDNSKGNNGDYYFDLRDNAIYLKLEDVWQLVVDFDVFDEAANVTFSIEGQENVEWNYLLSTHTVALEIGDTFATAGKRFPDKPVRHVTAEESAAGITQWRFAGWTATTDEFDPSIHGVFNDLTMIAGDITLYPIWEAVYA